MPLDPPQTNLRALNTWAELLACPACLSPLRIDESQAFCTGCDRVYPILDGIPILIPERADPPVSTK
ncbi:MAG: Trm112 family protein [Terracidiphilus sp.]